MLKYPSAKLHKGIVYVICQHRYVIRVFVNEVCEQGKHIESDGYHSREIKKLIVLVNAMHNDEIEPQRLKFVNNNLTVTVCYLVIHQIVGLFRLLLYSPY